RKLTLGRVIDYYRQHHGYLSLESDQLLIAPEVEQALDDVLKKNKDLIAVPTLVYLADTLSDGKNEVPYAVVGALPTQAEPPLGPFQPPGAAPLGWDEIILTDPPSNDGEALSPLRAGPKSQVKVIYYVPESEGLSRQRLRELSLEELKPPRSVAG